MKSKASFRSHPIHPILVSFPIAFFSGTLIFDILALIYRNTSLWHTGYYMAIAGLISALAAAVPGIIDYVYTVPPKSSAKKRATKHALLNVSHLIIFLIATLYKNAEDPSSVLIIAMEATGFIIMSYAGWLGGTLVYRNQIGVDPRYANAGKWKEEYFENSGEPIQVADFNELQLNQMKLLHFKDKRIVLGRSEQGYVAFEDRCPHRGGSLAGGAMICGTVQCPWHGSQFDVTTGAVKAGPAGEKINVYPLSEANGKIFLNLREQ